MIASINGEQTVKQLWIDGENIQLIPKNSRHKPIEMQKGMDLPDTGHGDLGDLEDGANKMIIYLLYSKTSNKNNN